MKLTIRERLCYGCGDLGSQFAYNLVTTYLIAVGLIPRRLRRNAHMV